MITLKLKSLEDASLLRKFSVLFTLAAVFPLVVLAILYYLIYVRHVFSVGVNLFFSAVYLAAAFALIGFIYMRQTLFSIRKLSGRFSEAVHDNKPRQVELTIQGENEVTEIAQSFNVLVKRLDDSLTEVDRFRDLLSKSLERELTMNRTDFLTGMFNRRVFYEQLELEIKKARRYHHIFTVLILDVDDFNIINEAQGHLRGDFLLCATGTTIRDNLRATDVAARLEGDRFAILLTETGEQSHATGIPRLRDKIVDALKGNGYIVTFSVGAITFNAPPASADEVISRVDSLVKAVKKEGKNGLKYEVAA